jgi:hypothetical protein
MRQMVAGAGKKLNSMREGAPLVERHAVDPSSSFRNLVEADGGTRNLAGKVAAADCCAIMVHRGRVECQVTLVKRLSPLRRLRFLLFPADLSVDMT